MGTERSFGIVHGAGQVPHGVALDHEKTSQRENPDENIG